MTRNSIHSVLVFLAGTGLVLAQTPPISQPVERDAYGQPQPQRTAGAPPAARPAYGLPAHVTLKSGTFLNVRINDMLASNKNQPGDTFSGTLMQPVVVDGVVVAHRGEMVYGRVAEATKVKGVSRLGVELTGMTLADGSQANVHSHLVSRQGPRTPGGQQAGTIATTTAVGAAVGAAADWGRGAAIGAGAGAAAGIIGVLVTRNHPSVIYPETPLTFELEAPLTIATGNAPQAFRYAGPEDYNRPSTQVVERVPARRPSLIYGPGYYPYYPYYWGPSVYIGGGFYRGFGGFRRWR